MEKLTSSTRAVVKVDGTVSLPDGLREQAGLRSGLELIANVNPDGSITLRPVDNRPVRLYTDEELRMFAEENEMTPELEERLGAWLRR